MSYFWRNTDFRPVAVPGWRVIDLKEGSGWEARPLAGWIVQDEIEVEEDGTERPTGTRQAVAAVMVGRAVETVDIACGESSLVLGPGDPAPEEETEARGHAPREAEDRARQPVG